MDTKEDILSKVAKICNMLTSEAETKHNADAPKPKNIRFKILLGIINAFISAFIPVHNRYGRVKSRP